MHMLVCTFVVCKPGRQVFSHMSQPMSFWSLSQRKASKAQMSLHFQPVPYNKCSITNFILMDYPIHIDTISMCLSILYYKGSHVKIYKVNLFLSPKIVFILANSADPDEMPHFAAFIWVITVCQSSCLPVSRMKRVKFAH